MITFAILFATLFFSPTQDQVEWRRGNTHTHTLWSDGDASPEFAIEWYATNGYDFLVLTDHNILQVGEDWFPVKAGTRLESSDIDILKEMFGEDWPETRERDGQLEMRLRTLPELKAQFEKADGFLLIPGEEVTDRFLRHEIHINAINIDEVVAPQRGSSVQSTIQRNFDAIQERGRAGGREVFAHVNHPNFGWSLTVEDLASLKGERFFEIYNGHRSVFNEGDATRPSTEQLWDQALVLRLHDGMGDGELLYGVATDDSHNHGVSEGVSVPGRGWVMVRSKALTEDDIVRAMKAGSFYASSGVILKDVRRTGDVIEIEIDSVPGTEYLTEFIATRILDEGPGPVGEVVARSTDTTATYALAGNELYVRARITSSTPHPRPYKAGDYEMAWTQPMRPLQSDATLGAPASPAKQGETDDRSSP